MIRPHYKIPHTRGILDLGARTQIMGILNTTPDSFSDGGKYIDPARALDRAFQMIDEGADIIDIGGESTRPKGPYGDGAVDITPEEESRRTVPVILKLASKIKVPISIDTTKSSVAKQAIEAGAGIINDISALSFDSQMSKVAAHYGVPIVLMHMQGTPKTMQKNPTYQDVITDIQSFFTQRITAALDANISPQNIILDPGFGFGKTFEHNIKIISQLRAFHELGYPILAGPSRKQFTGPHDAPEARLPGTIAAISQCILQGAHIVRVHDVKEAQQAAQLIDQIVNRHPL